ncbi:hypothetical protein NPIL_15331 [Nephila pilipes]|uniref:Uncharacterized protein n=1 Tax=Nephila pilipes TaxID=299642 RepID=A0A8X6Q126_NEPPI|nr:hypothetical protein NPIL_15331 [Nephila pilipes]
MSAPRSDCTKEEQREMVRKVLKFIKTFITKQTGKRVTIVEVTSSLNISHNSPSKLSMTNSNSVKYVCNGYHESLPQQTKCLDICQHLSDRFNMEGNAFLSRVVTVDETWVHYNKPKTKRQSMD